MSLFLFTPLSRFLRKKKVCAEQVFARSDINACVCKYCIMWQKWMQKICNVSHSIYCIRPTTTCRYFIKPHDCTLHTHSPLNNKWKLIWNPSSFVCLSFVTEIMNEWMTSRRMGDIALQFNWHFSMDDLFFFVRARLFAIVSCHVYLVAIHHFITSFFKPNYWFDDQSLIPHGVSWEYYKVTHCVLIRCVWDFCWKWIRCDAAT